MTKLLSCFLGLTLALFAASGAVSAEILPVDCTYTGEYKCGYNTEFRQSCTEAPWYCIFSLSTLWGDSPCSPVCTTIAVRSEGATWSVKCEWNGDAWVYSDALRTFCPHGCDKSTGKCIPADGVVGCDSTSCNPGDRSCDMSNRFWFYCGDVNKDGCGDWDLTNLHPCPDGCISGMCKSEYDQKKDSPCPYECEDNSCICTGTGGNYRVCCSDSDGDGCKDLKRRPSPSDACMYGCQSGQCKAASSDCGSCVQGQFRCGGNGADYLIPCTEVSTNCWSWYYQFTANEYSNWSKCPYGCETLLSGVGQCRSVEQYIPPVLNQPAVPDNYTFGYWTFDSANYTSSGCAVGTCENFPDSSGFGRHLNAWTGGTPPSFTIDTKFGSGALNLTTISQWWKVKVNSPLDYTTFDMWYRAYDYSGSEFYVYMSKNSSSSSSAIVYGLEIAAEHVAAYYRPSSTASFKTYSFINPPDWQWHHLRVGFWDNLVVIRDGIRLDNGTISLSSMFSSPYWEDPYISVGLLQPSASPNSIFQLDDLHISKTKRVVNSTCGTSCPASLRACQGVGSYQYSVACRDLRGFGCYEPWNEDPFKDPCGDAGCNSGTGYCVTNFTQNNCTLYRNYCTGTGGNSQAYCNDFNGDGFTELSPQSQWTSCERGCDPVTGQCRPLQDECLPGESRCAKMVDETISFDAVLRCGDMDHNGYTDWDANNKTMCEWGCVEDYYPSSGTHTASCNTIPRDVVAGANAVNFVSSNFNVAFEGPVTRMLVSFVSMLIAFVLAGWWTKSVTFGFASGAGVLGVCMSFGWVPPVIGIGLIIVASYLVFKAYLGGELTG